MNELVIIKNKIAVCDSILVAERFHKRHKNVVQIIERLAEKSADVISMFKVATYRDSYGREQKKYYMNRDGFSLLAMGFTGKDALQWKLDYIRAFNAMEEFIKEQQSIQWQQSREQSKVSRRIETDSIKRLVEYAKLQGSTHSDKLYISYTRLVNKAVGVSNRDNMSSMQLNSLIMVENMLSRLIEQAIGQQMYYKDIYPMCKQRVETFKEVAMLGMIA